MTEYKLESVRMFYALKEVFDKYFEYAGQGMTRRVYKCGDGTVIKIPHCLDRANDARLDQCYGERELAEYLEYGNSMNIREVSAFTSNAADKAHGGPGRTAEIIDFGYFGDISIVVMEEVEPLDKDGDTQLDWDEIDDDIPSWAWSRDMDGPQVGKTKDGRIVVYDYPCADNDYEVQGSRRWYG